MTTSGTIAYSLTANDLVTKALRLVGEYGRTETPSNADAQDALISLNLMLKSWQTDGCSLFRELQDSDSFTSGTATKTLSPRVLDVMEARLVNTDLTERPLARWERGEYAQIPNKTQSGTPTAYVLTKNISSTTMTLWPVPSATTTINYTAARIVEDVGALTETLDLPQEWLETVTYGLADRLIDPFDVAQARPLVAQRITARAQALYTLLRDNDRPASVIFG
jgi:hypothetical protein